MSKIEEIGKAIFFRGDSIPKGLDPRGRVDTMLTTFKTDGLLSKAVFDQCYNPDQILSNLPYYVAAHVGYKANTEEYEFSKKKSPFLSFSKNDPEIALHYMERTKEKKFKRCEVYDTEFAMFSVSRLSVSEREIGLYQFNYIRDYTNFGAIREEYAQKIMSGDATGVGTFILMDAVIKANAENGIRNVAMLIDVADYLRLNSKSQSIETNLKSEAIKRAEKSKEWLLFPFDIQPSEKIVSPRFSPNIHLKIEFRLQEAP